LKNTKQIELALNTFNYLIGKENFDEEFKFLLKKNLNIAKMIPSLVVALMCGSGTMIDVAKELNSDR